MPDMKTIQLSVVEIERYCNTLIELIESLSEDQIWSKNNSIPNSIGTLARHLTGNLNHYFGAGLLKNGYIRDREEEFQGDKIAKEKVILDLREGIHIVKEGISKINEEDINKPYKSPCGQEFESLAYHIIRIATHAALHCGQADYAKNIIES
jgi:hypothetical protein